MRDGYCSAQGYVVAAFTISHLNSVFAALVAALSTGLLLTQILGKIRRELHKQRLERIKRELEEIKYAAMERDIEQARRNKATKGRDNGD